MKLIIIESPGKVKAFKKYLGSGYEVLSSVGHVADLPPKQISVDIKKDFEPTFEVNSDKKDVVKALKYAAKKADEIYLMTDEDREGEGIAWHVHSQIKDVTKAPIRRATTNAITKKGIEDAIAHPSEINQGKVEAYLSRRILDRLAGYKTSFLTQQATGGKSAGRVQSAMLRLIVEREEEIDHFVPEEYWILTAHLRSSKDQPYDAVLSEKVKVGSQAQSEEIYQKVMKGSPVVTEVETKDVTVNPYAPFTTLPMIASASTIFGWGAEKTMQVAQGLYEAGHITYMRTDSPYMDPAAVCEIRQRLSSGYGPSVIPPQPRIYTAKAGAQEAHECCRPTNFNVSPSLCGDESKLYTLIWKRAVASQMISGVDRRVKVVTKIADYDFISHGNTIIEEGFRKIWDYGGSDEVKLPPLFEGEKCSLKSLDQEQKFTQPPSRYSDASLSKTAEKLMIARPSTFANSIKTLRNRGYIEKGKAFKPTCTGRKVVEFLRDAKVCFVDLEFTKQMEDLLDQIQDQKKTRLEVLKEFWERLKKDIESGKKIRDSKQVTQFKCPKCEGHLLIKRSNFGSFFSCQNYKPPKTVKGKKVVPEGSCTYTAKVGENGEPVEKPPPAPKEYANFKCNKCGGDMIKRKSKFGEFYGCSKFPKCRSVADLDGNFKEPSQKKWKKDKG
jgi:DNA topoisomerase-1